MKNQTVALFAALLAIGLIVIGWHSHRTAAEDQPAVAKEPAAKPTESRLGQSKTEVAIQEELASKTALKFKVISLNEAIDQLKEQHHIPIQFDMAALKDAGWDPTTIIISIDVQGITFRSALRLLLSEFNLAFVIQDESLLITSKDKAANTLATRVYDVHDLLQHDDKGDPDFDSLIDLVKTAVFRETWDDTGGNGSIETMLPAALVVAQTAEVQEQIELLLSGMRRAIKQIKSGNFDSVMVGETTMSEKKINKLLSDNIDVDFNAVPLNEVIDKLRNQKSIETVVDKRATRDAGVDLETVMITYRGKGISFRSALNGILRPNNLTWLIANEVLCITTKEQAANLPEIRIYPIGDLLEYAKSGVRSDAEDNVPDFDSIQDVITATIDRETWNDTGGNGSISPFGDKETMLVISQTREVHEHIADLFAKLREVNRKQQEEAGKQPVKPKEPEALELRVYPLRVSVPNDPAMTPQEVMDVVKNLVEPKSWTQPDVYIRGVTGQLIVKQVPSIHRKIQKLLDQIDTRKAGGFSGSSGQGQGGSPSPRGGRSPMDATGPSGGGGF